MQATAFQTSLQRSWFTGIVLFGRAARFQQAACPTRLTPVLLLAQAIMPVLHDIGVITNVTTVRQHALSYLWCDHTLSMNPPSPLTQEPLLCLATIV